MPIISSIFLAYVRVEGREERGKEKGEKKDKYLFLMIYFNFSQNYSYFERWGYKNSFLYLLSNLCVCVFVCMCICVFTNLKNIKKIVCLLTFYSHNLYIHDSVVFILVLSLYLIGLYICHWFLLWMVHSWIVDFDSPFNWCESVKWFFSVIS